MSLTGNDLFMLSHITAGKVMLSLYHGERTIEDLDLVFFLDSALYTSPLADFNPYPFPVINHNCEANSFHSVL